MNNIICPLCGSNMEFDSDDMEFKGKGTEYFICSNESCNCSMTQDIKFSQVTHRDWFWDEDIQKSEDIPWVFPTYLDDSEF